MKKLFASLVLFGFLVCSVPSSGSAFGDTVFMDSIYGGLTGVILSAVATAQDDGKDGATDPVARQCSYFIGGLVIGAVVGVVHASAKESRLEWRSGNIRVGLLQITVVRDARGRSAPLLRILSREF